MSNTFNIFVKKANQSLTVDFDAYPEHVKQHLIEYGLKQKFNDVHSAETDGEAAWGLVNNLQERLLSGELAKRGTTASPVDTKLRQLLRKVFAAKIGGKTAEINKLTIDDLVNQLSAKLNKKADAIRVHFTKIAEAQVEKEREQQAKLLKDLSDLDIE
jgi:hypothetical protein